MKLAEALMQRADAQRRVHQLRERLGRTVKIQEGEAPPEDPEALLAELSRVAADFNRLLRQINRTNSATRFDEARTLTDALADRDALTLELGVLQATLTSAGQRDFRYSRSEIRVVNTISIAELQRRVDDLARRRRELDAAIQALNWTTELVE